MAEVEPLRTGGPWGGAGSLLGAVHAMGLARRGQSVPERHDVHQRLWAPPRETETPQLPEPAEPPPEVPGDRAASRQGAEAWPAAGRSCAEVGRERWRAAPREQRVGVGDSTGYVAQLEHPEELRRFGPRPMVPPRLEKTAPDEIRADASAAEQLRRGRAQSAWQPGRQPVPTPPPGAVRRPRMEHPHTGFNRRLWPPATEVEDAPVGISRACSASPRWAPVRCGAAMVRLRRVSALGGGDSRVALPPRPSRQHQRQQRSAGGRRPHTSTSHYAGAAAGADGAAPETDEDGEPREGLQALPPRSASSAR